MVESIAGHDSMKLITVLTARLQKMLSQQRIKRLLLLSGSDTPIEIGNHAGGFQRYRLPKNCEGQQQLALSCIELLHHNIIKQVASNIASPNMCIDRHFEECAQAQIPVTQQSCQQGQR